MGGGLAGGELAGARAAAPRWGRGGREGGKGRRELSPEKNKNFTGDSTGGGVAVRESGGWVAKRKEELRARSIVTFIGPGEERKGILGEIEGWPAINGLQAGAAVSGERK